MVEPARVIEILQAHRFLTSVEQVPLLEAVGRVLREPVNAPIDSPPFDKAAMDGYAVRSEDLWQGSSISEFQVLETVAAGDIPKTVISAGQCVQIMTGAMMPAGADKVVRVEYSERNGNSVRFTQAEPNQNVIYLGENRRAGEPLLQVPLVLRPREIAVLASHGISEVTVARKLRVGVLSTGNEILTPGVAAEPGKIYDSNAFQIAAYCTELGLPCTNYGAVGDNPTALKNAFERALADNDLVISSGGVSMGEFDYVPKALVELGAEMRFHTIAYKPGKSTLFAVRGDSCVVGLAGNPAASTVLFRVLIQPLIFQMMGGTQHELRCRGILQSDIRRTSKLRREYIPSCYVDGKIYVVPYGGSSNIDAFAKANCVVEIDSGVTEIPAGEEISVRPL